jgi:hypothetical protein
MKPRALLGIYREKIFSPGKIEADAAIMDATVEELCRMGWEIETLHAESLGSSDPRPDQILSMAQSDRALRILSEWTRAGTRVLNTVQSVRNCYRKPLTHLLSEAGICIPPSQMLNLEDAKRGIPLPSSDKFWLKRGDVHAIESGDVASVTCREELDQVLAHFSHRNIRDLLLQQHVPGTVVKFYGVGRGQYFRAYSAGSGEEITSEMDRLRTIALKAAAAVGLEVYGGDAILSEANGPVLIDLNDWPSFSRCCHSAAENIAAYVGVQLL